MSLAASFALPEGDVNDAGLATFTAKAKVTYIDEDGDEITMTSNDELDDAFLQVLAPFTKTLPSKAKPFVITVTVPQDQAAGKASVLIAGKKGMPKRIQVRKIEPSKRLLALPNDKPPSAGKKSMNTFIHARHTCDGCQKSPIIGTRFHATKIPDFDLCATCYEKYDGDDLDFKPEIQGTVMKVFVYLCFPLDAGTQVSLFTPPKSAIVACSRGGLTKGFVMPQNPTI